MSTDRPRAEQVEPAEDPGQAERAALQSAVKLLSARGRSRHELTLLLSRKGFSAEVVHKVIERVAELGYLDDAAFARARAQTLLRARMGEAMVRERLREQGISGSAAEQALAEAREAVGYEPVAAARELLLHRGFLLPIHNAKERGRAGRLLLSRGFPEDVAERLLGPALDPGDGEG